MTIKEIDDNAEIDDGDEIPSLETLAKIHPDMPPLQTKGGWCEYEGFHRAHFYKLPDPPDTIYVKEREYVDRYSGLRWKRRRIIEARKKKAQKAT
jgi:hypothetical protein